MIDLDWNEDLRGRIVKPEMLPADFALTAEEAEYFASAPRPETLDFGVTRSFFGLADGGNADDPIRKEFMPTSRELEEKAYETGDPLCEKKYEAVPLLVHRYVNRALFRVTSLCATYCRFCYRRNMLNERKFVATGEEMRAVADYIASRPKLRELLISGGDPLVLDDERMDFMLGLFREARRDITLRVCTRTPVVLPARITPRLVRILKRHGPVRAVVHFNHPDEIADATRNAISLLVDSGIPVSSQTVLLRSINDDPDVLLGLFGELAKIRVTPYYLFQGDLAKGTSHFRVPLGEGIRIYEELERNKAEVPIPVYALDLPGGGGKVPIRPPYLEGLERGWFRFRDEEGNPFMYPAES